MRLKVFSNQNFEPSARVAMIGAGQLARMTHQAGIDYGIDLHVLAATPNDPAVIGGASYNLGSYDSYLDLAKTAEGCQVVTFDHELVPAFHMERLEETGFQLSPNTKALAFSQDKLYARQQLRSLEHLNVPVPAFVAVSCVEEVIAFTADYGWPVVLKARGGGYDGRGVHVLSRPSDAKQFLSDTPSTSDPAWVLEEHLELASEFAILIARRASGELVNYPPIGTRQEEGICQEVTIPARLPDEVTSEATRLAKAIVTAIGATGICAIEFFWTTDGRLLLNELALRPHNSGHITIEACITSQFHQHLRAVLDWPLGSTELISPAATVNLIGGSHEIDLAARLPAALSIRDAHIHLYAKTSRPGRKIGHVTALGSTTEEALETAWAAARLLSY